MCQTFSHQQRTDFVNVFPFREGHFFLSKRPLFVCVSFFFLEKRTTETFEVQALPALSHTFLQGDDDGLFFYGNGGFKIRNIYELGQGYFSGDWEIIFWYICGDCSTYRAIFSVEN